MLQLVLYFLLAAVLGAAFGWSIRGGGARHSLERLDQEWARRLGACEAECDRLRAELESAGAAGDDAQSLRAELAAAKDRIALLEDELVEASGEAATPEIGHAVGNAQPPQDAAAGAPPVPLEAPQGPADDLKRINGIGPGTERTLNGLGIYHFRQIADLSPENVAWIDRHLRFRGRIAREDWVGQARALAQAGGPELESP